MKIVTYLFSKNTSVLVWTQLGINRGFPGGSEVKVSASNVGDLGSILGSGRSPEEGNGNTLQYSCLENPMDGGAWWAKSVCWMNKWRYQWINMLCHERTLLEWIRIVWVSLLKEIENELSLNCKQCGYRQRLGWRIIFQTKRAEWIKSGSKIGEAYARDVSKWF